MQDKSITFENILEEGAWSEALAGVPTSNTYTSWAWGEYKKRTNWSVERLGIHDGKSRALAGALQLQRRKIGPVSVLLIQGGLHLRQPSDTAYHEVLEAFLSAYVTSRKLTLLLINYQAAPAEDAQLGLLRCRFTPVLNSQMYTFVLDKTRDALSGGALSKNWRHNLKRATNNPRLSVRWVEDPAERLEAINRLESFYGALMTRKAFGDAVDFSKARDLIAHSAGFRIVEATLDGTVVAVRVGFFCADHALDFLAASSEAAKTTYASYLLVWKLIERAAVEGKDYFDCGGINPAANMGVYNFKKGLGGRLAVNGPIWLRGSSPLLTKAARFLLSLTH